MRTLALSAGLKVTLTYPGCHHNALHEYYEPRSTQRGSQRINLGLIGAHGARQRLTTVRYLSHWGK